MSATAYDMGRNDYVLGKSMSDNRFKTTSRAYEMWQRGWIDGVRADPLIDADERAALLGDEAERVSDSVASEQMKYTKTNGGPAFPISIPGCGDNGWGGMSVRDWFAGQALSGLLQNLHVQGQFDHGVRRNVMAAYDLADAMMEEREKREAPPPPEDAQSSHE